MHTILISPYARLKVTVLRHKINSTLFSSPSARAPYVKFRVGHRRKRATLPPTSELRPRSHSCSSLDKFTQRKNGMGWKEVVEEGAEFEFKIDLMDARRLLPDYHIGRVELRLSDLTVNSANTIWLELLPKNTNTELVTLGVVQRPKVVIGAIELHIDYAALNTQLSSGISEAELTQQVETEQQIRRVSVANAFGDSLTTPTVRALPGTINESEGMTGRAETADKDTLDQTNLLPGGDFLDKLTGIFLSDNDVTAVRSIRAILSGFGQGIEGGSYSLSLAFILLQKFFAAQPRVFTNNTIMTKRDLELPRIMYKYTEATMGWRGLNFFGRGGGMLYDLARTDADRKTVLEFLRIPEKDLLIFNLDEHLLYRPNYFVCIDRQLSALILSIRGTMSMRDTLTDMVCEYVPWKDGLVHSGMLTSSRWFLDNLVRQLLLWCTENNLQNFFLVGHSLGGGTSALTTMLILDYLQDNPKSWPTFTDGVSKKKCNIHCYSYGTPCIVSHNLAPQYTGIIDCFVNGDDIVPRLSFGSCSDLRLLIIHAASLVQTWHLFTSLTPNSPIFVELARCRDLIQSASIHPKLTQPGSVHHFIGLPAPKAEKYRIVETVSGERFGELELRQRMLVHHLPSRYLESLEEAYVNCPDA